MVRADHPKNITRGCVCAYIREYLPVHNFSYSKKDRVITLCRCRSQTFDEFGSFISNLEKLIINITSCNFHFVILLGDFNAKSNSWSVNDTMTEGTLLENLTCLYGIKQLISAPTHILQHSLSCIGFIFENQPNLVIDSGIHPSLHQNFHHKVIYFSDLI